MLSQHIQTMIKRMFIPLLMMMDLLDQSKEANSNKHSISRNSNSNKYSNSSTNSQSNSSNSNNSSSRIFIRQHLLNNNNNMKKVDIMILTNLVNQMLNLMRKIMMLLIPLEIYLFINLLKLLSLSQEQSLILLLTCVYGLFLLHILNLLRYSSIIQSKLALFLETFLL